MPRFGWVTSRYPRRHASHDTLGQAVLVPRTHDDQRGIHLPGVLNDGFCHRADALSGNDTPATVLIFYPIADRLQICVYPVRHSRLFRAHVQQVNIAVYHARKCHHRHQRVLGTGRSIQWNYDRFGHTISSVWRVSTYSLIACANVTVRLDHYFRYRYA